LSYQFISADGTQSAFDSMVKWTDYIVPKGKQIRTVETLLDTEDGFLRGFKWVGDDRVVLVAAGDIDS
jgi:hypothetical protein